MNIEVKRRFSENITKKKSFPLFNSISVKMCERIIRVVKDYILDFYKIILNLAN